MNLVSRNVGVSGGVTIVDGSGVDLTITPVEGEERKPCRITVTLLTVFYTGYNVGSNWTYTVSTRSGAWYSGPRVVQVGMVDAVNTVVQDEKVDGACGLPQGISIGVRARERDWWIFDDIGDGVGIAYVMCEEDGAATRLDILVPVPEYPMNILRWLFWWLFRQRPRTAWMRFIFSISSRCIT